MIDKKFEPPPEKRKTIIQISILFALIFLFFCYDIHDDLNILVENNIFPVQKPPPDILLLIVKIDLQYLLCLPLFILLIRLVFKHTFKEAGFIFNKESYLFIGLSVVAVSLIVFLGKVLSVWNNSSMVILIGNVITCFFLVGFMEELIFRGFIFNRLLKFVNGKRSFLFAVLTSAALFSLVHAPLLLGDMVRLFAALSFTFLFGIWAAVYYFYSRNIIGCVVVHGMNNIIFDITNIRFSGIFGLICYYTFWVIVIAYTMMKVKKNDFNEILKLHLINLQTI